MRHQRPAQESQPEIFLPFAQSPAPFRNHRGPRLESAGSPSGRVQAVLREIDPNIAAKSVRPMEAVTRRALAGPRFQAVLAGGLAAPALLLASAGLVPLGVALLAAWLPARRAAAVEPMAALRRE